MLFLFSRETKNKEEKREKEEKQNREGFKKRSFGFSFLLFLSFSFFFFLSFYLRYLQGVYSVINNWWYKYERDNSLCKGISKECILLQFYLNWLFFFFFFNISHKTCNKSFVFVNQLFFSKKKKRKRRQAGHDYTIRSRFATWILFFFLFIGNNRNNFTIINKLTNHERS